ncbi:hypothetical protein H8959_019449 [Pygathrix nigripes]
MGEALRRGSQGPSHHPHELSATCWSFLLLTASNTGKAPEDVEKALASHLLRDPTPESGGCQSCLDNPRGCSVHRQQPRMAGPALGQLWEGLGHTQLCPMTCGCHTRAAGPLLPNIFTLILCNDRNSSSGQSPRASSCQETPGSGRRAAAQLLLSLRRLGLRHDGAHPCLFLQTPSTFSRSPGCPTRPPTSCETPAQEDAGRAAGLGSESENGPNLKDTGGRRGGWRLALTVSRVGSGRSVHTRLAPTCRPSPSGSRLQLRLPP